MTLITNSADTDSTDLASISFTSGIDTTYKLYIFKFIDIHPESVANFTFQASIDGGSNYNVTNTSTHFRAQNPEDDSDPAFGYQTGADSAQTTTFQDLIRSTIGTDNDQSGVGELYLFNPASTTYVKHYHFRGNWMGVGPYSGNAFCGGYFNDANDINAVQFKMSTGNMNGVIKMYGVG